MQGHTCDESVSGTKSSQNNIINHLKAKVIFTNLVVLLIWSGLRAQTDTLPKPPTSDSLLLSESRDFLESTRSFPDSIGPTQKNFELSKDSLDAPVDYTSVDSMIYDVSGQKIHLYGDAVVNYTTITLKADHIILDWNTNIVTAEGMPDSLGRMAGFPEFQDGDQQFTAKRMRYNFQTRKGVVFDVTTKQNDVVVHGTKSKFISQPKKDSTSKAEDIVYSQNSLFTTCTHPEPHFGIRSNKQKIIANKLVVIGPSRLEIMNVPTPLWLPFGFFPITSGRRSGLLFPRDYEYSQQWGFGIRDIGWFFPLGDNFNLTLTGNIYLKGTWGITASSQYRKRYKYSGNLQLGYDVRRSEADDGFVTRNKSFVFRWSHTQDRAAHPTVKIGGSINIQTNNYQSRVFNDAQNVLQNQLNSNFNFSKVWTDKPFSLTAGLSHNQNSSTRNVTINFPTLNFVTQTLFPFKRKKRVGPERWYEKITMRYRGELRNQFTAKDTTLFTSQTLRDARFGAKHDINTGTSFKVLKYFNLNPNITYKEVWYLKSLRRDFIPELDVDTLITDQGIVMIDTNSLGFIRDTMIPGFESFREFSAGISLNTQIFGTVQFKKGWLRGIRHVIKPSISFSFSPNYLNPNLGYFQFVQDTQDPNEFDRYSIFEGQIFGGPPQSGRRMALSYSINNIFEAKYFSKKDSTDKKLKLFNNIAVSGSYNFEADSLKWSPVNMSGTTRFFKGATTMSVRASFDPYITDENGRRINQTVWSRDRKLLRFVNATINLNTRLTVGKIRALFQGKEEEVVEDIEEQRQKQREQRRKREEQDFLSLFERFNISHNLSLSWNADPEGGTSFQIRTHALNFSGSIQLTDNWDIRVGNFGYDFVRNGVSYPSFGFSRDLHCWEMGLNWQPTRGTYSFYIQVKPGTLDFLKIPYERNNADAFDNGFR